MSERCDHCQATYFRDDKDGCMSFTMHIGSYALDLGDICQRCVKSVPLPTLIAFRANAMPIETLQQRRARKGNVP